MKHLISINQFSKKELLKLFAQTAQIKKNPQKYANKLKGKIIATLFFEPSTRTRLSFTSAALRLGSKVLGFADAKTSSTKKGESLEDTIKVVSNYADMIIMRHFEPQAAKRAAEVSQVPIINGGDGINEHPTQALLDMFTINEQRAISNGKKIKVALVGDLKYGRTVHSLSQGLAKFKASFYFISPKILKIPNEIKQKLTAVNIKFQELETWDDVAQKIDVLYMTRIQKERFPAKDESDPGAEYERLKNSYLLNKKTAQNFKDTCLFMHPLPRVGEIDPALDNDPRTLYFKEAANGVWVRMALLLNLIT